MFRVIVNVTNGINVLNTCHEVFFRLFLYLHHIDFTLNFCLDATKYESFQLELLFYFFLLLQLQFLSLYILLSCLYISPAVDR